MIKSKLGNRLRVNGIFLKTHVILSKKAVTGSEELPGNHMSVKDKDGNIVEEWLSGEQPHELIAKLKAGERYWICLTIRRTERKKAL